MYEDKTLVCKECGNEFVFTAGEQEFYAEKGFQNEPQRCKSCRDARKNGAKLTNGTNLSLFEEKEQLDVGQHPRIYKKQQTEFSSDSLSYGDDASFDTDALLDSNVFQPRSKTEDLYFSYSYTSTTAFVPDWTFKNDVRFTYALKDGDDRKISDDRKYVYGYVFSDYLTNSAEGFQYNRNYLHLGNSVSPSYIRRTIANHGPFTTSSVSALLNT